MKAVACSTAALLIACFFDWQFKGYWQESGADLIVFVQYNLRCPLLDLFFFLLSEGSVVIVFMIVLARFFDSSSQESFKTFVATFTCIWVADVLKNLYSDPRPYWTSEPVEAVRCSSGWGNPSGHAMMVTSVALYQCWLLLKEYPSVNRVYVVLGGSVCFFLVEFDRIYLGVHFYSQLILGTLLAVTMVSILIALDTHLNRLHALVRDDAKWALLLQVPSILMCVVSFAAYSWRLDDWRPEWSDMIRMKCSSEKFGNYCSVTSLYITSAGVLPFALAGVLNYLQKRLISNWWMDISLYKRIARLIIASLCLLVLFFFRSIVIKRLDVAAGFIFAVLFNYITLFALCVGTLTLTERFSLTRRGDRKTSEEFDYELVEPKQ